MIRKKILIGTFSLSLMVIPGCDTLKTFHENNIQKVAELKGNIQKSDNSITDSEHNLAFKLNTSASEFLSKDIRPEMIETAKNIVAMLDEKFNEKTAPTEEDALIIEESLEPYREYKQGDENFGEETLTSNEKSLLRYLEACITSISHSNYADYLDSIAGVKSILGRSMTFNHDIDDIKASILTKEKLRIAKIYESFIDEGLSQEEALQQLINVISFCILYIQADKDNPSYIHIKYEMKAFSDEPETLKESYRIEIDPEHWNISYRLVNE